MSRGSVKEYNAIATIMKHWYEFLNPGRSLQPLVGISMHFRIMMWSLKTKQAANWSTPLGKSHQLYSKCWWLKKWLFLAISKIPGLSSSIVSLIILKMIKCTTNLKFCKNCIAGSWNKAMSIRKPSTLSFFFINTVLKLTLWVPGHF